MIEEPGGHRVPTEPTKPTEPTESAVTATRTGWWRRNRLGLVLLPVAIVAALAGNAQRLQTLWWEEGLRSPQRPDASGVVRFVDEYDDGHHRWPITPALSVVSVEPADTLPGYQGRREPLTLPTDGMLWKVTLHVEADPSLILTGCTLALVDAEGTRWESGSRAFTSEGREPASPCTPADRPGPSWLPGQESPVTDEGEERPARYDVDSYVVTVAGARPDEVWVWWDRPTFAALPVTPR